MNNRIRRTGIIVQLQLDRVKCVNLNAHTTWSGLHDLDSKIIIIIHNSSVMEPIYMSNLFLYLIIALLLINN